jgi:hypothetical protein
MSKNVQGPDFTIIRADGMQTRKKAGISVQEAMR